MKYMENLSGPTVCHTRALGMSMPECPSGYTSSALLERTDMLRREGAEAHETLSHRFRAHECPVGRSLSQAPSHLGDANLCGFCLAWISCCSGRMDVFASLCAERRNKPASRKQSARTGSVTPMHPTRSITVRRFIWFHMATFTIDTENNIAAHAELPAASENLQLFATERELAKLAAGNGPARG